jgi:two-component system OmpR family sensor kinase
VNDDVSIRGIRFGFLFVVALFALVGGFTLLTERHTNERIDELVRRAGERSHLIDRIRLDAMLLETAVSEHINAQTDEDRGAADEKMEEILSDIEDARDSYTQDLPPGETEAWTRFSTTSKALAEQVRTAVRFSNRRQAERARKHLEESITPVTEQLDELADQLSAKDAEETQKTLHHREDLRARTLELAAGSSVLAIALSLFVAFRVVKLLGRQRQTIAEQLDELARRNRELDAFASRVAHDLVSPLAPLKGYLTLIRRSKTVAEPSVIEMLTLAESSAGRMGELVEALLRFCRAGNQAKADAQPTDLEATVTTLLLEVSQTAAANHVQLDRQLETGVRVAMPPQLLSSVAQNLLSNAVKYSAGRSGAKVSVRVFAEKADAVLEVTDNGMGMSAEAQRSLFQPFFRAPNARALPGHGLGLATTKRLVEAHAGTISFRSAEGAGTQVVVRLPRARELTAAQPALEPRLAQGSR